MCTKTLLLTLEYVCVQVYEVTIFEADDDDSFDEDTEITEAVSLHANTQVHTQADCYFGLTVYVSPSGLLAVCEV